MSRPTAGGLLAAPHLVVGLLVLANVAAYLLCLRTGGTPAIPTPVLAGAGALTPAALEPGERWRLAAAGFLHADPTHLLFNLLSLLVAGPVLERRLGGPTFALVYAAALAGAGITSVEMHAAPFVGVGASGAIFGVMGALVALWALGAEDLSARFFLVNFGLNAAAGGRDPRIDWAAHIGGFVTGMAMVASLDVASRVNRHWLRCKFPDFVKAETFVLLAAGGAALWGRPPLAVAGLDPRPLAACCIAAAALAGVKLLDVLLSSRRGLAAVVLVLAGGNAAAAWGACAALLPALDGACRAAAAFGTPAGPVALLCPRVAQAPVAAAGLALVSTLLVLWGPLRRGSADVRFVGATLMAERRRERGLVPTVGG